MPPSENQAIASDASGVPWDLDRVAVTIGAAAAISVISAPMNLFWLHWFIYPPMLWVLREETPRANRWLALLYGTVCIGFIFRWVVATIAVFSNIPVPLAALTMVLFATVFGAPYVLLWSAVHPLRRRLGDGWILAIPALQVVIEYVSMHVLLFPFHLGIGQYRFPPIWQLASVTGVWGITWLIFFVNCAIGEAIYRRREGRPFPARWVSAAVAFTALVALWGSSRYARIEAELSAAPQKTVALIQTSKTMTHRFSESRKQALYDWVGETDLLIEATEPGDIDLVIWSEGASPYNVHEGRVRDIIADRARAGGFELLVGGGTVERFKEGDKEWIEAYNSVYLFGRDGEIRGRYDKVVPLPFGEYLPLANVFPWLKDLIKGPGDFRAGEAPIVLEGESFSMAPAICYEAILPGLCRRFPDPDVLINPTNDAWFGDTAAPHQHAMLATARAVELGIPVIRAGYTGVSFVVEPHGRIYAETRPFERTNSVVRVRMGKITTIYQRFGDWFVLLCALGLGVGWFVAPWRRGAPNIPKSAK